MVVAGRRRRGWTIGSRGAETVGSNLAAAAKAFVLGD
jgi:hypothetical protein